MFYEYLCEVAPQGGGLCGGSFPFFGAVLSLNVSYMGITEVLLNQIAACLLTASRSRQKLNSTSRISSALRCLSYTKILKEIMFSPFIGANCKFPCKETAFKGIYSNPS